MHDVLDLRDLVPDEAEQRALSGFQVGDLRGRARSAAESGDVRALEAIRTELAQVRPSAGWPYDEPDDDETLRALAGAVDSLPVDPAALPARMHGAWLGRTVGNTLGKPVEGLSRRQMEIYLRASGHWPQTGYLPLLDPLPTGVPRLHPSAPLSAAGRFTDVPRDDDIDWTILNLHLLETHGRQLTTEDIAGAWLDRIPFTQTYTAERAAYRNLVQGLKPPATATHDNPYREWIGALIRGDAFGYAFPGDPGQAAAMALVDARLSHTGNGKYGEMWSAALMASALGATSAAEAVTRASGVVPSGSRLHEALFNVLSLRADDASHVDALDMVDQALGNYPWVHTVNNAALIAIGLLWGETFMDAVGITLLGGRDTDSNGATVGGAFGAIHGFASIPPELVGTTHVHVRSAVRDFDRIRVDELATRTLRLAQRLAAPEDN
jgi:ADP-ribosylglycohydrolase